MEEMSEREESTELPAVLREGEGIVEAAEHAYRRIEAFNKIKNLTLKLTTPNDWVDLAGKPYLQTTGALKVGRFWGISWRPLADRKVLEEGGYYRFEFEGEFSWHGQTIYTVGSRSSKDDFFRVRYEYNQETQKKDKKIILPPSEVDEGDVRKAAFTNWMNNGIKAMLGMKGLVWDDLAAAGIKKGSTGAVDYGKADTSEQTDTSVISEAQRKRFYGIAKTAGKSDDTIKEFLRDIIKVDSSAKIPRSMYDEACKWAEKKEGAA